MVRRVRRNGRIVLVAEAACGSSTGGSVRGWWCAGWCLGVVSLELPLGGGGGGGGPVGVGRYADCGHPTFVGLDTEAATDPVGFVLAAVEVFAGHGRVVRRPLSVLGGQVRPGRVRSAAVALRDVGVPDLAAEPPLGDERGHVVDDAGPCPYGTAVRGDRRGNIGSRLGPHVGVVVAVAARYRYLPVEGVVRVLVVSGRGDARHSAGPWRRVFQCC